MLPQATVFACRHFPPSFSACGCPVPQSFITSILSYGGAVTDNPQASVSSCKKKETSGHVRLYCHACIQKIKQHAFSLRLVYKLNKKCKQCDVFDKINEILTIYTLYTISISFVKENKKYTILCFLLHFLNTPRVPGQNGHYLQYQGLNQSFSALKQKLASIQMHPFFAACPYLKGLGSTKK